MQGALSLRAEFGKETPHELTACLHCLYALLAAGTTPGSSTDPRLRITLHVPSGDQTHYQQVIPYVGDRRSGDGLWREFPAQSGIVGKALRSKEIVTLERKSVDIESFIRELINDYAYTEADARKLDSAAQSWLAIPLLEPDTNGLQAPKVHGVLYVDSVLKGFFAANRVELAMHASVGLMRFVFERHAR
jgi:hypothetical protein